MGGPSLLEPLQQAQVLCFPVCASHLPAAVCARAFVKCHFCNSRDIAVIQADPSFKSIASSLIIGSLEILAEHACRNFLSRSCMQCTKYLFSHEIAIPQSDLVLQHTFSA